MTWTSAKAAPPHRGPWLLKSLEAPGREHIGVAEYVLDDGDPWWIWEDGTTAAAPRVWAPIPAEDPAINPDPRDRRPAFLLGKTGAHKNLVVVGVPDIAWNCLVIGQGFDFDFRMAGLELSLFIFRETDHAACVRRLEQMASDAGAALEYRRTVDPLT